MVVTVKGYGSLKQYTSGMPTGCSIEIPAWADPSYVFRVLHIPHDVAVVFFVNGRVFKKNGKLMDGDEIVLFSPMEGG